jgi:hypothetical protein
MENRAIEYVDHPVTIRCGGYTSIQFPQRRDVEI